MPAQTAGIGQTPVAQFPQNNPHNAQTPGMPIQNPNQAWAQVPQQFPQAVAPHGAAFPDSPQQGVPAQMAYATPQSERPKIGKRPILAMVAACIGVVGILLALLQFTGQDDSLRGIAIDALDIADDAMAAVGSLDSAASGRAVADDLSSAVDDLDGLLSKLETRLESSSKEELIEEVKELLEDKSFQDKTASVLKRAINIQETFNPESANLEAIMAFQTRLNEIGSPVDQAAFEAKGERIGQLIEAKFSNPQDMLQLTGPMLSFIGAVSIQVPELQTIMNNGSGSFFPF